MLPELDALVKLTLRFGVLIAKGFERTLQEEAKQQQQQQQQQPPQASPQPQPQQQSQQQPPSAASRAAAARSSSLNASDFKSFLRVMEDVEQISHPQSLLLQVLFDKQHPTVMAALLAYEINDDEQDLVSGVCRAALALALLSLSVFVWPIIVCFQLQLTLPAVGWWWYLNATDEYFEFDRRARNTKDG